LKAAQIWREPQQKNQRNHTTVPAQIWRELAPHYFRLDSFGGSSDLAGATTKTRHNHTSVPAQIWWELAPYYFKADCFGGSYVQKFWPQNGEWILAKMGIGNHI
jgi:hypothetical protein